jgi:hypothetical protein
LASPAASGNPSPQTQSLASHGCGVDDGKGGEIVSKKGRWLMNAMLHVM